MNEERAARNRLTVSGTSYLLFALWLEAGYATSLALIARVSVAAALWQAAVCVATLIPLLLAVVKSVAAPKGLKWLPRGIRSFMSSLATLVQFIIPWIGWSLVIWLLNAGGITWTAAFRSGLAMALFSYLTGVALLFRFRPRAEDVVLTRTEIPIAGLPPGLDGYRILHISDLHAGPFLSDEDVALRLSAAASACADLIAFTGDLAEDIPGRVDGAAEALSRLTAPDGIVAVLGNHDIWTGERRVREALEKRGVKVLVNAHTSVVRGADTLYIVGVNDASYTHRDDLEAAFDGVPKDAVAVLLSHAPAIIRKPPAKRASLILSGHTHGGQVVLPLIGALYVPSRLGRRYASGLYPVGRGWLYISRGLGEVIPPFRIGCPPEIAILTLRAAASH